MDAGLARAADRNGDGRSRPLRSRSSSAFFERVRAAYLERARREPGRFRVIDAAGTRRRGDERDPRRPLQPLLEARADGRRQRRHPGQRAARVAALARGRADAPRDWRSPADACRTALLLHGPDGVGKERFAAVLAAALFCSRPRRRPHALRRVPGVRAEPRAARIRTCTGCARPRTRSRSAWTRCARPASSSA